MSQWRAWSSVCGLSFISTKRQNKTQEEVIRVLVSRVLEFSIRPEDSKMPPKVFLMLLRLSKRLEDKRLRSGRGCGMGGQQVGSLSALGILEL